MLARGPARPQLIQAPRLRTDHFPAITDALCHTLEGGAVCVPDWKYVRRQIARTAEALHEVVDVLQV